MAKKKTSKKAAKPKTAKSKKAKPKKAKKAAKVAPVAKVVSPQQPMPASEPVITPVEQTMPAAETSPLMNESTAQQLHTQSPQEKSSTAKTVIMLVLITLFVVLIAWIVSVLVGG